MVNLFKGLKGGRKYPQRAEDPTDLMDDVYAGPPMEDDPSMVAVYAGPPEEDPDALAEDPEAPVEDPAAPVEDPDTQVDDPEAPVEDPENDPNDLRRLVDPSTMAAYYGPTMMPQTMMPQAMMVYAGPGYFANRANGMMGIGMPWNCSRCGKENGPLATSCGYCGMAKPANTLTPSPFTPTDSQPDETAGEPETTFCPCCGSKVLVGARFCNECGSVMPRKKDDREVTV